jgi:hypothetical protein
MDKWVEWPNKAVEKGQKRIVFGVPENVLVLSVYALHASA